MFNWVYKVISGVFLRGSTVQYIQPKTINVHFANSKNPQVKLINLANLFSLDLNVSPKKLENETAYSLIAIYNGESDKPVELAEFETRAEAENALRALKVKMSSPSKAIVKWIALLVFLLAATSVYLDIHRTIFRPTYRPAVNNAQLNQMNGINIPEQDLENLRKQYEQLTGQPAPNVTPQQPLQQEPQPQQQAPRTPGNELLDKLGK